MMTIKIIQGDRNEKTSIYAAKWLQYEWRGYTCTQDFVKEYKAPGREIELLMMFPPDDESFKSGEPVGDCLAGDKTQFVRINFIDEENEGRFLFAQHAMIYIMQDGQTIDKIIC